MTTNLPAQLNSEALWLLTELTGDLSTATDLDHLQLLLSQKLRWVFDFDYCSLAVRSEPTDDSMRLLPIIRSGGTAQPETVELPLADNWPSRVMMERKPYYLDDLSAPPASIRLPADKKSGIGAEARSVMLLPLQFEGQSIGSLNFSSKQPGSYSIIDRNLATMLVTHLSGKLGSFLAHQRATTTLKNLLVHQANHDSLTGLPDRKLFEKNLQQRLNQVRHSGQRATVFMIDLDRFKLINDTLGLAAGDFILQQVTQRMQNSVYQSDTVARLGGDEFALILTKLRSAEGARQLAQNLLKTLEEPFMVEGQEVIVTASIGIAFSSPDEIARELMRKADRALQRAKEQGKNNCQLFNPDMDVDLDHLAIEVQLRKALERGEMRLRYQPQIELATGKLTGCEALLRWQHPELGLVSPAKFIPLAEESGMIIPLGNWVIREACRQNRAWQDAGYPKLKMSVNVSPLQFGQDNFVELVAQSLQESKLGPQWFELELTESTLLRDYAETAAKLSNLRELGVEISIDDFGTGYSSLSYLQRLPANSLKIDQSFVHAISAKSATSGPSPDGAIIQAIITMAQSLGMKVVAEGVEIEQQQEFLRQLGCDLMQGYLFSAPLEPAEFERLIGP